MWVLFISSGNYFMTLLNCRTAWIRLKIFIVKKIPIFPDPQSICPHNPLSSPRVSSPEHKNHHWGGFLNFLFSFLITNFLPLFLLPGWNRAEKKLEWGSEGRKYSKCQWMCYTVKEDQSAGPKTGGQINRPGRKDLQGLGIFLLKNYGLLLLK